MQSRMSHVTDFAVHTLKTCLRWPLPFLMMLPLSLSSVAHGQVAAPASGTLAVDAYNHIAVTADLSGKVMLFDTTTPGTPALLSTYTAPAELTGVALAGESLLVSGQQGVEVLDISNPKSPVFGKLIRLDSEAVAVRGAGNLGYTAFGSTVVLFDISSGKILDKHEYSSQPVTDLALSGDYLYLLSSDPKAETGLQIVKVRVQGSLGQAVASWTAASGQVGKGRMSLFAGDKLLYIGSELSQGTGQGLQVLEDQGAFFELKSVPQEIDARMVRPSGLGLLAFTGATGGEEGASRLGVLDTTGSPDLAKALDISQVLHVFDTSGPAQAVTLYQGYAYVAAGSAGLQVIPYASPNGSKAPPSVALSTSTTAEAPWPGSLARLTANVTAADQVRKVDFYLNGKQVASAGGYPFEYRFFEADPDPSTPQMVSACVEDIDGNSFCSEPEDLNTKSKNTLTVSSVKPLSSSHSPRSKELAISAQFSLPLDVSTVALKNVSLVKAATKTAPSSTISLSSVTYQEFTKSIAIQPKSPLASGSYKVVLSAAIKSSSTTSMAADYVWSFDVDPATDTWSVATSGDWNTGSNWSLGTPPAAGDSVVIDKPGVTVTLSSNSFQGGTSTQVDNLTVGSTSTLTISGGNLSVTGTGTISNALNLSGSGAVSFTNPASVATLNQSGGTLSGPGVVTLTGTTNTWSGGIVTGTLDVAAQAVLGIATPNANPNQFALNGGTINNTGTVNLSWNGAGYGMYVTNGAMINNAGAWNLTSDVAMTGDASSAFNNTGTFTKSGGTATSNWSLSFGGTGALNIQAGGLTLSGAYTRQISGTIAISSGAHLNYGQGGTLAGSNVTGGGTMVFYTGTTTVSDAYTFAGTTDITGGTVTFQKPSTIVALNLTGGTLSGPGVVTLTGTTNTWSGGIVTGTLDVAAQAVLGIATPNANPNQFALNGGTINNTGTVNLSWNGAGYGMYVTNGAMINNAGAWNLTSDVAMTGDASSAFNNTGTFTKSGGTATSNWSLSFGGTGALNIQAGGLTLSGAYTRQISGTIAISSGAHLNYGQGGTLAGSNVTGGGTMVFYTGTTTVSDAYTFAGTTDITGGTVTFQKPSTIVALNLTGGTLSGPGVVTLTGTANTWSGGIVTGTLDVAAQAVLGIATPNANPNQFALNGGTINNTGTVNLSWNGAGFGMYVTNGAMINNAGAWNLTSNVAMTGDASSAFNNSGTFTKTAGSATSNWSLSFGGPGALNIQTGGLTLSGAYTRQISGTIALSAGAHLNYGQGGTLAGSNVTGSGTINFYTGTTTVSDAYTFAGTTDITGGTVTFQKPSTIVALNLTGGTLSGPGVVTLTGTANTWSGGIVTGTLDVAAQAVLGIATPNANPNQFALNGGTINNTGTVNLSWNGAGFGMYVTNGAMINNAGAWNLTSNVAMTGDASSAFNNSGTFTKTAGSATSNWSLSFGGPGALNIQTGGLTLSGAYTRQISGTIALSAGAHLNYGQGGTLAGSNVTGSGTINFYTGTTTVSDAYTFAGTTDITGGTVTFQKPSTIVALNLTGGTLSGPGVVTLTGTANTWSGGIVTGTLDVAAQAVLGIATPNANPNQFALNGGTINNTGTVNLSWNGAGFGMYVTNGAMINNAGAWNLTSNVAMTGDASSAFNNSGTFTKTAGSATSNWSLSFGGPGALNIQAGTLNFTVAAGMGTLNMTGGGITGAGAINCSGNFTWTGGEVSGTGNFTVGGLVLSPTGNVDLAIGNKGTYRVLNVGGSATLKGALTLSYPSGFAPAIGTSIPAMVFASNTGAGSFGQINNGTLSNNDVLNPVYASSSFSLLVALPGNASQTISFGPLANQTYGASPIILTATASSGLPVSYTATGPATVSGSTLTITGAGAVVVTASQPGNSSYAPASNVSQSFSVAKAVLTATAGNLSRAFGATNPTLTYTVKGFVNGDGSSVVGGSATLTTTATSTSPVGTYPITFATENLTAANYTFTYITGTLTVAGGASQTITFGALANQTYGVSPLGLSATASSGLPITYTVTGPATVSGSTLIITGAGSVTVTASQPGNSTYSAAPSVSQTFTVVKAVLTATGANLSREYGAANPTLTYTLTGFVNGDTSAVVSGSATLSTTATNTSPVGTYPITFATESLAANNYTFTYLASTLTVLGGASQTITFGALANQTYGVSPITLTATASSGLTVSYTVTGPATVSGSTLKVTGAGSVTVTASQAGNSTYAAAPSVSQTFTVNKAVLTATAVNQSRQFGAANPALIYGITGFVNGDTSAVVSGTATLSTSATSTSSAGTYPITFSTENLAASNYTFIYLAGTLTVTGGASQTLTFGPLPNLTYGAAPFTLTATASSGLPVSYTVTGPASLSGSTLTIIGAGTVTVTASQPGNADFTAATPVSRSFTVARAVLMATAVNQARAYDVANPALTYTVAGFVNNDTSAVVSGTATLTTTATLTSPVGTYPITFATEGLIANNYTFSYVPGTLTVGNGSQSITFGPLANLTYGAAPFALTATASSGLPVSYTVTGPATLSGSTLTIIGAGTVTVTASQAGNADFTAATPVSRSFTVARALLTATAVNQARAYNLSNPALTYTVTGFVNSDASAVVSGTATLTTTATLTSPVGTYPITFATEGLIANNYTFSYVPGTLTVGNGSQTITFAALSNLTYGAAPFALTATASSGLPVSYTVTGPATLSGSTLTIIGAGTVTVTASQAGNADFSAATPVSRSFTVAKVVLMATAVNQARAYDVANPALTYTVTGFVGSDTTSVVSGSATLATTATLTSPVGTYPITFATEGLIANNYTFSYVPGTLTVGNGSQSITFAALPNLTYGAAPFALTATASSGLPVSYTVTGPATLSGSTLTITGAGTVTVTASQVGNADFTAATPVSRSFTVAKAVLMATAVNQARAYNLSNPALTYTVTGFVNSDTSAVVSGTATLTTTATLTSPVGTYPITFATEGLTANNYTFSYVPGTLTVTPLAIVAVPTFSLAGGNYSSPQTVMLSDASTGAAIHYTLDGSMPTANSPLYTLAIQVTTTETITAIAILNNVSSAISSQTYTINPAQCQTVNYSKGFTSTGLSLNGGATVTGNALQLTDGGRFEARSAFYPTTLPLTSYTTDFTLQILNPEADGVTFVIQSNNPKALGEDGGGLGYAGIPNSMAFKLDLHNNDGEGIDSTGMYLDGAYPSTPAIDLAPTGIDLHSGHVFAIHITYANALTTGTITDTVTGVSATGSFPGDITKVVGNNAYIGFTGATGNTASNASILTWSYSGGTGCSVK